MRPADTWKDYELLDATDGNRLERWGETILIRPDPQVVWKTPKQSPLWAKADAVYHRSNQGGGEWEYKRRLPEKWKISCGEGEDKLTLIVSPTGFKHTGVFPEQAVNWAWYAKKIRAAGRPVKVLNLFGYTGGATLACAAAGATVCHVDASKGIVAWGKDNAAASGLADRPIRWLVDDCAKFVAREKRRGNTYDGIIMDPPSYGRGPGGEIWKLEDCIYDLISQCEEVLSDTPLFFAVNSYTTGLSPAVMEQFELRHRLLLDVLTEKGIDPASLHACVGRGGLLPPVRSGAYRVNDAMLDVLRHRPVMQHASNLGAVLADAVARPPGIPAVIYDPVTVDEMDPIARITGFSSIERKSVGHMLNMRACALRYATQNNAKYPNLSLIVAHMGGGITLSLHVGGRVVDMISDDEGPFSPERSGGLPCFQLAEMATQDGVTFPEMMRRMQRKGGLMDWFGTSDAREIERRIHEGDGKAALVYEAMAHNLAKNIGKLAVVTRGRLDAILLTGGVARSRMLTDWVAERVSFLAPVHVLPGENEMESLALGVLRVLRGEEEAHTFAERTEAS